MKAALTIAGSDPTGGAGLQADIRVFRHFGVWGLSAVSSLTAQNTSQVAAIVPVTDAFLDEQLTVLINDIRPDALKTGMLYTAGAVRTVVKVVRGFDLENLVIDPVTVSSTGTHLAEPGVIDVIRDELLPLARVITPNISEAAALSGISIRSEEDMQRAAVALRDRGAGDVIITGGHTDEFQGRRPGAGQTLDLLFDGSRFHPITGRRAKGVYHGTGCAYSAAITALLARGSSVHEAARKAKEYVDECIRLSVSPGRGMRLLHV
ncbi:MAG TPA: bifunctional hydroxymethylpyrimidine kinase/phosphomethylpyrimidine kinase [Dissulfurispiraceae bacterium]|nr:bifunctional hydroxymethylpyrimidine kinase/phosphomethylpyrimidine kinase [Dissulfurispiraceae bacterium]